MTEQMPGNGITSRPNVQNLQHRLTRHSIPLERDQIARDQGEHIPRWLVGRAAHQLGEDSAYKEGPDAG
jgi:hypothetical protein